MAPRPIDLMTRFEPDLNSGCWLWSGATSGGYGMVNRKGLENGAHRVFYKMFHGPVPEGLEVCHRCDTPPCVNPAHLFVGTKSDNQKDCVAKGRDSNRVRIGETNSQAVLSEAEVVAIYSDARAQGVIAAEYGVHRTTINLIQSGKKWGWLTKDLAPVTRRMGRRPKVEKIAA